MERNIITVDKEKCTGCGLCVQGCPEGALQIVDGKACLVGELLCDGLGACIGDCPEGALFVERRESEAYDEIKALKNIIEGGANVIKAHFKHLKDHNQEEYLKQAVAYFEENGLELPDISEDDRSSCGCLGSMSKDFRSDIRVEAESCCVNAGSSQLSQWPVQLQLLSPSAPYFAGAHLLVAADCVPFAYADFHQSFLKDKILIMFCPKLDKTLDQYLEKLTLIFKNNDIKSITIVRMEVPCCGGVGRIIETAMEQSGKKIRVEDIVISIRGEVL